MKKVVTYLIFGILCLLSINLPAQLISITPDELFAEAEGCWDEQISVNFKMKNLTNDGLTFYWKVERVDVPESWEVQVCDAEICHIWGREECPEGVLNDLDAQEEFSGSGFKVRTQDYLAGIGYFNLLFFNDLDSTDVYASVPIEITATGCTSDLSDLSELKDLSIYPNPTADYFQVGNTDMIQSISIYNIVGAEAKTMEKSPSDLYDVSDLNDGMYLLRLLDQNNEVVKVTRLSKN